MDGEDKLSLEKYFLDRSGLHRWIEWMNEWLDRQIKIEGWMGGWMDEWMDMIG